MLRATLRGLALVLVICGIVALVVIPCAYAAGEREVKSRDIVFVHPPACPGDIVFCAVQVWFSGDWSGVRLCRSVAHPSPKVSHCVRYEDVFPEGRR